MVELNTCAEENLKEMEIDLYIEIAIDARSLNALLALCDKVSDWNKRQNKADDTLRNRNFT